MTLALASFTSKSVNCFSGCEFSRAMTDDSKCKWNIGSIFEIPTKKSANPLLDTDELIRTDRASIDRPIDIDLIDAG